MFRHFLTSDQECSGTCYGEIETHRRDKVEIEVTQPFRSIFTVSRKELPEAHKGELSSMYEVASTCLQVTARQE